jgi:hypothetical protein
MAFKAEALLDSLDDQRDTSGPWMLKLYDTCEADPRVAFDLVLLRARGDERLIHETMRIVIGLVPFLELPKLVEAILDEADRAENLEPVVGMLKMIAEQSPEAFHHVLDRYFEVAVKFMSPDYLLQRTSSQLSVPWTRSGKLHFEFLKRQIKTGDERRKGLAWYALLRCGYRKAYDHARIPLHMPAFKPLVLHDILMDVGISIDFKPLHTEEPLYMVYESDLPRRDTPMPANPDFSDVVGRRDATFNPPERLTEKYAFGGALDVTCGMCGKPLHRMIRLDPVPETLSKICTLKKLDLATCYSCSGWIEGILYFCHDDTGEVTDPWTRRTRVAKPEWPSAPIVPTTVTLGRADARWNVLSPFMGNQDRVGGPPVWVQQASYPSCPSCSQDMHFIAQLGRDDYPTTDGGHVQFGSGGNLYAFWCDKCRVSANFWQCT